MKTWQCIEKACKHSAGASATSSAGERSAFVGEISAEIPYSVLSESGEDEEDRDKILVQPEFPGLWSQKCDLHKVNTVISLIRNRKGKKKVDEILL